MAIQYDPREDVLQLSYSRRTSDRGTGTLDLQSITKFGIKPGLLRGRVLKARTQPFAECHFSPEAVDNATADRLFGMIYEGRELVFLPVEGEEIDMVERRSPSLSPPRCADKELLKGQMLATGRWSDVAADIVWGSTSETLRHEGVDHALPLDDFSVRYVDKAWSPVTVRCMTSPQGRAVCTLTIMSQSVANAKSAGGLLILPFLVFAPSVRLAPFKVT